MNELQEQTHRLFEEFLSKHYFHPNDIIVIGCSTSEVAGGSIGKNGSSAIAAAIFDGLYPLAKAHGLYLAFQCCEHLNRALVVNREIMEYYHLEEVSAVPHDHAGGAMASYAYRHLPEPCLCETIQAHGGWDIGETLIGMHLRSVAVPLRLSSRTLGEARLNAAYTRPKLIGGERAKYSLDVESALGC